MKRDIVRRPPVTITKQLLESTVGISLDRSLPMGSRTHAAYGGKLLPPTTLPTSTGATKGQSTLKTPYSPVASDEEITFEVDMNGWVPPIVLSAKNYTQVVGAFSTDKPITVSASGVFLGE